MIVRYLSKSCFLMLTYRSFKVVSANSAKISARIQNLMMILDSDHPASSK